ncbi:MAG: hypothetical protein WBS20_05875, partial [Lysobacterales bacterium]
MKRANSLKWVLSFSLVVSLLYSLSSFAGNPLITSSFSGIWDQPEQESQGIILQIGEQEDDQKVGIAYWFTYGPDLNTAWYLGVGPVTGNEISMTLYTAADIGFMASNLEGDESVIPVGTLDLVFHNCNQGAASFTFEAVESEGEVIVEAQAGDFPIKRISSIYHQRCSGGISDDTPKGGKPLDLDVNLLPVDEGSNAKGKAKFWERTERTDFKVEVENLDDGTYTLEVCGGTEDAVQFEMPVALGMGELEFRSPFSDGKLDLN